MEATATAVFEAAVAAYAGADVVRGGFADGAAPSDAAGTDAVLRAPVRLTLPLMRFAQVAATSLLPAPVTPSGLVAGVVGWYGGVLGGDEAEAVREEVLGGGHDPVAAELLTPPLDVDELPPFELRPSWPDADLDLARAIDPGRVGVPDDAAWEAMTPMERHAAIDAALLAGVMPGSSDADKLSATLFVTLPKCSVEWLRAVVSAVCGDAAADQLPPGGVREMALHAAASITLGAAGRPFQEVKNAIMRALPRDERRPARNPPLGTAPNWPPKLVQRQVDALGLRGAGRPEQLLARHVEGGGELVPMQTDASRAEAEARARTVRRRDLMGGLCHLDGITFDGVGDDGTVRATVYLGS